MSKLDIYLFGVPQIELNAEPINLKTHKALGLIAYLLISEKQQSREALASLFWPLSEPDFASAALRTALWRINKSGLGEWLMIDRETVGIRYSDNIFVDTHYFINRINKSSNHGHGPNVTCNRCISILEDIVKTYRTGFMQGYFIKGSREYEEWHYLQTERMRFHFSTAIGRLVEAYRNRGDLNQAINFAHHWLQIDPYHDEANRLLIQLYADAGLRDSAIRLYNEYVGLMKSDLSIPPDESVTRAFHQIKSGAYHSQAGQYTSRTGLIFHLNLPSMTSFDGLTGELYLENLTGYIQALANRIRQYGGKVFNIQLDSITALFTDGDPLNCALGIQNDLDQQFGELFFGQLPGIVIHEIMDRDIFDLMNTSEFTLAKRMSQTAWRGQILITPQVLAKHDLPQDCQIIDFGTHTFFDNNEPIQLLGLIRAGT